MPQTNRATWNSWVYLVFFNMLWVFLPIFAIIESYRSITSNSPVGNVAQNARRLKKNA